MDGTQFDDLLRRLAQSRRSAIATLLAAAGGLSTELAGEAKKKKKKRKKRKRKGKKSGKSGDNGETTKPPTTDLPDIRIPCATHADCSTGLRCHPAGFCECFPDFCTGCCVDETHCLMLGEMTDAACGYAGLACGPCPAETRCTNTEEQCRCDAESTQGCCLAPHHVSGFPGTTAEHCGQNGEDCVTCSTGENCIDHQCLAVTCDEACEERGECHANVCYGSLKCCSQEAIDMCSGADTLCDCLGEIACTSILLD